MAFLANYRVGSGQAGAYSLYLQMLVAPEPGQTTAPVSGLGTITQAISPPLTVNTHLIGTASQVGDGVVVNLTGTAYPGTAPNFAGVLVLPNGWGQDGEMKYWFLDGGKQQDVGPVPAQKSDAAAAA